MAPAERLPDPLYEIAETRGGEVVVRFLANLTVHTAPAILKELRSLFRKKAFNSLVVDLGQIHTVDDYGALVITDLRNMVKSTRGTCRITGSTPQVDRILDLVQVEKIDDLPPLIEKQRTNFFVRCGELFLDHLSQLRNMVSFLGSVILAMLHVLLHPRSLRVNDTLTCMEKTGVNALPIVALISFLLGLVIAFMSSLQLQQFGANIYVASLVSIAMVSELGPIMTAIVVAGRSGSAFAAEIGTMKISEEIDALFLMGFAPTLFLVVPRITAAVIVVPLLTLFSDLFAICGGLFVGVFLLDLTMSAYIAQSLKALSLFEVMWGLSKSVVFAAMIGWIGCLRGFQTRGGADAVGNAATSAVVTSIFFIILVDSIFVVVRSYWG
jgi:phospholipid/cholesterol/gamma-HCH transport system permease protein